MAYKTSKKYKASNKKNLLRLKKKSRKNNKSKKYFRRGGNLNDNEYLIKNIENLSLEQMLDKFNYDLSKCKSLESKIISKSRVIKASKLKSHIHPYQKPICKYDESGCYQKNPDHFKKFAHPSKDEPDNMAESRLYIKDYKDCTDKLIMGSYAIYKKNNGVFPDKYYGIVTEYLKASDFADFRQYHFNVLANMCENMERYANLYDEDLYRRFITNFLFVLEEACAVTGMYFTNDFKRCLSKLGLKGQEATFLSNTNLYNSNILQSLRPKY